MDLSKSILLLFLLMVSTGVAMCYPLSTNGKWIMDDSTGHRVKFACVNWAGHLEAMMPEGLHKQPLKNIVAQIPKNNFNCVRLTYAIHMWTRHADEPVLDRLKNEDLSYAIPGFQANNPTLLNMTHVQVFEAVVNELGAQNVRVLLDNHVSFPKWCCNDDDDNGFFNDRHFDPDEWTQGLTLAAKQFAGNPAVVAMSLRNEPHGARQNVGDWRKYMSQGAMAVHQANPQVLVVISGLNYDTELQFLRHHPLKLDIGNKLAFETHLYSWSGVGTLKLQAIWSMQPLNRICAQTVKHLDSSAGFVTRGDNAVPLLFTEFGFDQTGGVSQGEQKFVTCLLTYLAAKDLDWALWALQGSYYAREDQKQIDASENFGVLDSSWSQVKNPSLGQMLQLLQKTNIDPSYEESDKYMLYHPLSGQCVTVNQMDEAELTSCDTRTRWYRGNYGVELAGTNKCLSVGGEGQPVFVSAKNCISNHSALQVLSLSQLHLGIQQGNNNNNLCLHKDTSSSALITAQCVCIDDTDSLCLDDPRDQWFQLVPANV